MENQEVGRLEDKVVYLGEFVRRDVLHRLIDLELAGVRWSLTEAGRISPSGPPLSADDRAWLAAHRWHVYAILSRTPECQRS